MLLYQTDIRLRTEHLERLRRVAPQEYDDKKALTPDGQEVAHSYREDNPWEFAFTEAPRDMHWWHKEFESKATVIIAKMGSGSFGLGPEVTPTAAAIQSTIHLDNEPLYLGGVLPTFFGMGPERRRRLEDADGHQ